MESDTLAASTCCVIQHPLTQSIAWREITVVPELAVTWCVIHHADTQGGQTFPPRVVEEVWFGEGGHRKLLWAHGKIARQSLHYACIVWDVRSMGSTRGVLRMHCMRVCALLRMHACIDQSVCSYTPHVVGKERQHATTLDTMHVRTHTPTRTRSDRSTERETLTTERERP